MKLVALVRKPDGKHEAFETHVEGVIVHCFGVNDDQNAPVTVDAPEDTEKEPETKLTDFHMAKAKVIDKLMGKVRYGMVISRVVRQL